jgi:hypothetical protein
MIKVGVWCVVVLFALSIATAVCLDHRNAAPEYDDFVIATATVDSPLTNGDGRIGSFSRIPEWMYAINSDLAGIDPDSLRPSLQRSRRYAIRTPDETAHNPTCVSAPESIGDRTIAEPTVPDPGTLDFTDVIANHWKLDHRKKHQVPANDVMSTRKSREVINGDLQVPLSWNERYERFALLHPPQVSVSNAYTPLGWALRIFYIIALVVFVSALVRYFHLHRAGIDSHLLPAFSTAGLTVLPREIVVPVAHLVPAEPYHPPVARMEPVPDRRHGTPPMALRQPVQAQVARQSMRRRARRGRLPCARCRTRL